jgi:uncharacterized membrane protein
VPESRIRKKSAYTPPPTKAPVKVGSPPWLVPVMIALFVIGLLWIVVYYISQTDYPIGSIGPWNMAVGFGFIIAGFIVATRWK